MLTTGVSDFLSPQAWERVWLFAGKLHPVVVHFPIALLIVACVLEFFRRRRGDERPAGAAIACALIGAVTAAAAAAMGWSGALTAGHSGSLLEWHRWLGIAVAGVSTVAAVLALSARYGGGYFAFAWYRLTLVLAAALVAIAGHFGGSLVYGSDYAQRALAELFPPKASAAKTAMAGNAAAVNFEQEILPLLGSRCFSCHSGEKPEAGLILTSRAAMLKGGKSGIAALTPGDAAESLILKHVRGEIAGKLMPPKGSPLAKSEIAAIEAWVASGAPWGKTDGHWHWAYKKIERPNPPTVKDTWWARNDIDRFVLARLEKEGLRPSEEADRATLIRRVSLDLIGLPPTVREVDEFVRDTRADAYDRVVDRLLGSPHYGERWARPWLDLARYADTHGYEKDARRIMWPYRDWVINALNEDLPFDRFTIEQLAGDMLENPTREQLIATGFNRNTMINEEGGVDEEEFRAEAVIDRVNTFGSVWLGSTVACAQCHDHKFDPIKHTDYYSLFAIFNQDKIDTRTHQFGADAAGAMIDVPRRGAGEEFDRLAREIESLAKVVDTQTPQLDAAQAEWERAAVSAAQRWKLLTPVKAASAQGASATVLPDGSVLMGGSNPDVDTITLEFETDLAGIAALKLETIPDESLPARGAGRSPGGNFVLTNATLTAGPRAGGVAPSAVKFVAALADFNQGGAKGPDEFGPSKILDTDPKSGWAVAGQTAEGHALVLKIAAPIEIAGGSKLVLTLACDFTMQHSLGRFRVFAAAGEGLDAKPFAPAIEAIARTPAPERSAEQRERIAKAHRSITPLLDSARKELAAKRDRHGSLLVARAMVMQKNDAPRETHVFERGSFLSPGEKVEARVPAFLPQISDSRRADRLALAEWLFSPDNPLTARVAVNRMWESFFGKGIVETSDDLGTQGDKPTHPQLLDWLATEFRRQGWSQKQMHRLIVTSATYRQSAAATPELLEKDPRNLLLARQSRHRVEAEMVRDIALASSGLLSPKLFGPSVFPPQPEGTWTMIYNNDQWKESTGEDKYRRGVYTFCRRTSPYPTFVGFDAPSREIACTRRPRTNTPLQSLTTMNDPQFVEAAGALARRVLAEGGETVESRAAYAMRLCVVREPSAEEIERLSRLYIGERARFESDEENARELCAQLEKWLGPTGNELKYEDAELAAWWVVANVVLNLDETLTRG